MVEPRLKICPICKQEKPYTIQFFYPNKTKTSGLDGRCRECVNKRFKQYKAKLGVKERAYQRYHEKRRAEIKDLKIACAICGYDRCKEALEFHHLKDKELAVSEISYNLDRIKDEIDKCVLLCANCHREIHNGFASLKLKPRLGLVSNG